MKIKAYGDKAARLAVVLYTVVCVFMVAVVGLAIQRDAPAVAYGLYVFIAIMFVYQSSRMLLLPNKCWVHVGPEGVAWRTPAKIRWDATPTGSATKESISGFEVVPQQFELRKGRPLNGEAVRLTLTDGATVTLPIWTSAMRRSPAFEQLIVQLRSVSIVDHSTR
jgi:hypothetical protein